MPVRVVTSEGLVREASTSMFVIPWGLLATFAGLVILGVGARKLLRRRTAKVRRLKADLDRLEELLESQGAGGRSSSVAATTRRDVKHARRAESPRVVLRMPAQPGREDAASARRARARAKVGGRR